MYGIITTAISSNIVKSDEYKYDGSIVCPHMIIFLREK